MRASCQRRETGYTKTRVYDLTHEAPSPKSKMQKTGWWLLGEELLFNGHRLSNFLSEEILEIRFA